MNSKSKIKHYNIHIIKILGVLKWALNIGNIRPTLNANSYSTLFHIQELNVSILKDLDSCLATRFFHEEFGVDQNKRSNLQPRMQANSSA